MNSQTITTNQMKTDAGIKATVLKIVAMTLLFIGITALSASAQLTSATAQTATFSSTPRVEIDVTQRMSLLAQKIFPGQTVEVMYILPATDQLSITLYDEEGGIAAQQTGMFEAGEYMIPFDTWFLVSGEYRLEAKENSSGHSEAIRFSVGNGGE